jgi:hypothetical protein
MRRATILLILGACLLAGCGHQQTTQHATTGLGSVNGSASPSAGGGPASPPQIPTDPQLYSRAAVQAFIDGNQPRYNQLVDAGVTVFSTISGCSGCYDMHFKFNSCTGAAGSAYCLFVNNVGDELTVQLSNERVAAGAQHGVINGKFEPITFPADQQAYAQEALDAWINHDFARLGLLTASGVATASGEINGVDGSLRSKGFTYDSNEGAAGSIYYVFKDSAGDALIFRFQNISPNTSNHHLIIGIMYQPHQ